MHPDPNYCLELLSVSVPLFFAESCGYRGEARFVAMKWDERADALWVGDNDHAMRGFSPAMKLLWRRPGGCDALARYRTEIQERGETPWFLIDRKKHTISLGEARTVWHGVQDPTVLAARPDNS